MNPTVLITGGSRGIGAQTVKTFYHNGYNVAFCYHNAEHAAHQLSTSLPGVMPIKANLADAHQIEAMVQQVLCAFGHVDVLVLNAGISLQKLLPDTTCEEWDDLFAINLRAMFLCCRAILPAMIAKKSGSIVTVSSIWGQSGASCEVAYSASKAGVIGFTKALAKEVGPSNIRVNCVAPGVIDTDMNAALSLEDISCLREETPLGCIGTAEQVAQAIFALASPSAAFITGQVLGVNGGLVI
ncbi:elongation factor P 5-aminopentanone reductase [Oscillospiraceae bacterium LTW-04]|nr:3-oxoacyl-ACP reductase FabG [Oscillospiraceae bacterium MB24-C1]